MEQPDEDAERKISRLHAEVQHYEKLAMTAKDDVQFWERAGEEREKVVADLRVTIERLERENQDLKQARAGGPSKLEELQAEALAQKSRDIERLSEAARTAQERITAAELQARKAVQDSEEKMAAADAREIAAEEQVAKYRENELNKNSRISALERHLSKRSDEVTRLREALGDYDPAQPDRIKALEASLEEADSTVARVRLQCEESTHFRAKLFASEAEVAQLAKQRKHLEHRITELSSSNRNMEKELLKYQGKNGQHKKEYYNDEAGSEEEDEEEEIDGANLSIDAGGKIRKYSELIQEAYDTDLSQFDKLLCFGITAKDLEENPVVVLALGNIPKRVELHMMLLAGIRFLEDLEIVANKFSIVFVGTEKTGAVELNAAWLMEVMAVLPHKYKHNIKKCYILHPSIATRMMMTTLSSALGTMGRKKVVYCSTVNELMDQMHARRIILPDYVYRKEGAVFDKDPRGEELMVQNRKLLWDDTIIRQQRKRKVQLLSRDQESLEYFHERLASLVEAGRYEEAQRVEQDIAALEDEITDLRMALEH